MTDKLEKKYGLRSGVFVLITLAVLGGMGPYQLAYADQKLEDNQMEVVETLIEDDYEEDEYDSEDTMEILEDEGYREEDLREWAED